MKSDLLFDGLVLLVVGGLIFMFGYNGVQEYQTTLGQIGRALSHSAQQEYQIYMLMETAGGLFALAGFVLSIAGALSGEKVSSEKVSSGRVSNGRVERRVVVKRGAKMVSCPICGCSLNITTQTKGICPKCENIIEILYEG